MAVSVERRKSPFATVLGTRRITSVRTDRARPGFKDTVSDHFCEKFMMASWADAESLASSIATALSTRWPQAVLFALQIFLFIYFCYTVAAIFRGAAPIPTRSSNVRRILALSNVQPGELLVDLGSGDGRILRAAAARGARCLGFEINPFLCWYSRLRAWFGGSGAIVVEKCDFWRSDLSKADVV